MALVVVGIVCVLLYAVMAAWMAKVARTNPTRTFEIGKYGRIRWREVTAAEWIRRYVPWGLGGGCICIVTGLLVMSASH